MKQVLFVILIVAAVAAGGAMFFLKGNVANLLRNRHAIPSPIAACTQVSAAEAQKIAQIVVDGFNELDPDPVHAVFDLQTLFGEAIHQVPLSDFERSNFLSGAMSGAKDIPNRWIAALGEEGRVKLLRIRLVDGHQRAQLRMLVGDGLNYLDLTIVRTPAGAIRVVDYQDMATGEPLSRSITSVVMPALASLTRTPLERLMQGSGDGYVASVGQVPELRKLIEEGKHQQAMERWRTLPEAFRTTRAGAALRMLIAQGIGPAEHLASLQEIERLFPNDPALSLLQVDANRLTKRYPQALQAIDRVDEQVGGDPYLDSLRADILIEAERIAEAQAAAARGCEREPTLIDLWWTAIGVSLKADAHAQTASLLDEVKTRFGTKLADDLSTISGFERFGQSKEYAEWRARQPMPKTPATSPAVQQAVAAGDVRTAVIAVIAERLARDPATLNDGSRLTADLKADELDIAELLMDLEDAFSVKLDEERELTTIGDLIRYVEGKVTPPSTPPTPQKPGK